ncbi:MAG: GTPase HflX [Dehalococcoidia bacterium]|nr:GTPase HflX [Dehalococcoidia bacterium]
MGDGAFSVEDSLEELASLAGAAGAEVVGAVVQRLRVPSRHSYLGSGKVAEIAAMRAQSAFDLVILDDELSILQQRHLEDAWQVKVIDRTALILDIFAQRARTKEGLLQVELAQAEYLLPRLAGQWSHLERLGGGIGTRGPGESQLETDRRLVRQRVQRLREQLEAVRGHRARSRLHRARYGIPVVAIVGYTSAGKSTLLNALTGAEVYASEKLFATLDPTTRRLKLPNGQLILLTDTVGFIHKLPPTVVAAFRATLEELEAADLLLHVVDITHPNAAQQSRTVEETLASLGLAAKPVLLVLNKIDRLPPSPGPDGEGVDSAFDRDQAVLVSAATGQGLGELLQELQRCLVTPMETLRVRIPYQASSMVALFKERGVVEGEEYRREGTVLHGQLPSAIARRFAKYRTG